MEMIDMYKKWNTANFECITSFAGPSSFESKVCNVACIAITQDTVHTTNRHAIVILYVYCLIVIHAEKL